MSQMPVRFVHASDLHLELPPFGVAEVPEHLREVLIECAFWAAERIFAVALAEEADFLVLSGDVLQPQQTGPRGPLFLAEQFERLAERGIAVYWAGGEADPPETWPTSVRLPENVHRFPTQRIDRFTHRREGKPLASVAGMSRQPGQAASWQDFTIASEGLFTIAVVHSEPETMQDEGALGVGDAGDFLRSGTVDYWALGGSHARKTALSDPRLVHWPGTPQGREPGQIGPHGCTIVQVDSQRRMRTTFAPCDVLRWQIERIMVDPATSTRQLESQIVNRIESLRQSNPGVELFVSWRVAGEGRLLTELRRGSLAQSLLETLRSEHGFGSPAVWSLDLTVEPPPVLPASWYDQQTILGDFLRELRRWHEDSDDPLVLEEYLAESQRAGPLAAAAVLAAGSRRDAIVHEATMLGYDLLSGEGPTP